MRNTTSTYAIRNNVVQEFASREEALRFAQRRGDASELWVVAAFDGLKFSRITSASA